jgi:hypothetical protein
MKKYIFASFGILFLFPAIALASWWNPLSWTIFSWVFQSPAPTVQVQSTTTSSTTSENILPILENQTSVSTTDTQSETTPPPAPTKPKVTVTAPIVPKGTLCNGLYYSDCSSGDYLVCPTDGEKASCQPLPNVVVPVQTQNSQTQNTQPSGTYCNGKYWNSCLSGQNFVCPQTGDAYCQTQAQAQVIQQQQVQQQNNSEINLQIKQLEQQIIDIKTQYYQDVANEQKAPVPLEFVQGRINNLTNTANQKIDSINLQIQELQLQEQ